MLDITLSRSAFAVCMTRLAMRPAKSFWKKGRFWRTTCQWLCQRIRFVTPGMSAFWRTATSLKSTSGRTKRISTTMPTSMQRVLGERRLPVGRFHERDHLADEKRDHGVDQRDREAGHEHDAVPAPRLLREVPVERA